MHKRKNNNSSSGLTKLNTDVAGMDLSAGRKTDGLPSLRTTPTIGVDDLATLPELNENVLLNQLQARYQNDIIYTYIGDILLAVNPYKNLNLYAPQLMDRYTDVVGKSSRPPHIFAMSDCCFANMWRDGVNQCCVVSGESGAGKTESTKLLVQHIVHLCQQQTSRLHERIVEVNPLLEAFGNARTAMNNNSSRFGKFIEIQFDRGGKLLGATITEYLLEKSRVVQQNAGERNFHIFYYLFAGLDQKKQEINLLKEPAEHRIMCPVDGTDVFPDAATKAQGKVMWDQVLQIMEDIGFDSTEREAIIAMLTAVVHIGDIKFVHDTETDGVYIENEEVLEIISVLLGLNSEDLGGALIANVSSVRGEEIVSLKNVYQANDGRDALAKALYGRLFGWIVRQINRLLNPKSLSKSMTSISVLDIYGFEDFQQNSFEQLCINSANEQLQMFFNRHIFRNELEAYASEGIKTAGIKYADNEPIIKMLFDPMGLYSIIDEESKFPKATDLTLVEKMAKTFAKHSEFQRSKTNNLQFLVQHYAGTVAYNVYGFLDKNRDTLSPNLFSTLKNAESSFVSDMFTAIILDTGAMTSDGTQSGRGQISRRKNIRSVILDQPLDLKAKVKESSTKKLGAQIKQKGKLAKGAGDFGQPQTKTLSSYFKNSLKDLMDKMSRAQPHFIRCFKPNSLKVPDSFDTQLILKQMRYTGVMETVNIRRQGFAVRLPFDAFIYRYKFIGFPMLCTVEPGPNNCKRILASAGITDYEFGKTKIFLRYHHADRLDVSMQTVVHFVVVCQAYFRGFCARLNWKRALQASAVTRLECQALAQLIVSTSTRHADQQRHQDEEDMKRVQEAKKRAEQCKQVSTPHKPKPAAPPVGKKTPTEPKTREDSAVEKLLESTISRLPTLSVDIWCKLHYFEKNRLVAKFYVVEWNVLIDNGPTEYDGRTVGLSHSGILHDSSDEAVESIFQQIGKGVKVDRDNQGNLFLTRLTNRDVFVRGCKHPEIFCLSDEILKAGGRVGTDKIKVYDIIKFSTMVAEELRRHPVNMQRIQMFSSFSFSFVRDDDSDVRTPCWINIINFCALELLSKTEALTDIVRMSGAQLSTPDISTLKSMSQRLSRRRSVLRCEGSGCPPSPSFNMAV